MYLDTPMHDKYSHPADMLRYMAMGLKHSWPSNLYVRDLDIDNSNIGLINGFDV